MSEIRKLDPKPIIRLSVIIPVGPNDQSWSVLLLDLKALPAESEIIFASPDEVSLNTIEDVKSQLVAQVEWLVTPKGRAVQQNLAAQRARGEYLLFLHADSKLPRPSLHLLFETMNLEDKNNSENLYHFDLQFLGDGPKLVHMNSLLANWRSRYLKMPFGDQGFFMNRKVFDRIGGFPEDCAYGEDHVFVWEARRKRILVVNLRTPIFTSARKYQRGKWGQVTREHVWMTTKQAVTEGMKLLKTRIQGY